MRKLAQIITKIIDFFYRPFSKWISEQLFRYAACGGGNLVLDWVLYFLIYNFVIGHNLVYFQLPLTNYQLCLTPHIATLCIVFPITLLTGFWLQKYVTFTASRLNGWRQLSRYILIVAVNLAINYFGLKLCVDVLGWYPTPSKMLITIITVVISYLGQKHYTLCLKEPYKILRPCYTNYVQSSTRRLLQCRSRYRTHLLKKIKLLPY